METSTPARPSPVRGFPSRRVLTQDSCICEAEVSEATAMGPNLASERAREAVSGLLCSHLGPASPQESAGRAP